MFLLKFRILFIVLKVYENIFWLILRTSYTDTVINNNNNNNLYLSVKAKIAVTEPLNGDTISEIYIYIYININVNIKVLKNLF